MTAKRLCLLTISVAIFPLFLFGQTQRYDISPTKSKIIWVGKKVIGSDHKGTISLKGGTMQVDQKSSTIKSANIEVDMNVITCTDITDAEWNGKLVNHLKSEDFFDVAKFSTSSFELTSIKKTSTSYEVSGLLTIKGITNTISFPASISYSSDKVKIKADNIVINRTVFGIKYGSSSFFANLKDKAIADEFTLDIDVVADLH